MKRENIAKLSAVIITVVLVAILLSQISIGDVVKTLISIEPIYLIIGFILYLCSYFIRALRFHILLNHKVSIKDLFTIVCVHNMVNNILPARTGELSYIYLLQKYHNKKVGEGIATLLVARVFDFISISLLFFISALMIQDLPEIIMKAILVIAFFFVLVVIFLITLLSFGESFINLVRRFFRRFNLEKRYFADYLLRKGKETVESFEKIKTKKTIFRVFLFSGLLWSLNYLIVFILLNSMNIFLPFPKIVVGATFILLITVLPIQGIGGFGTTEGVWAVVFVPLGLSLKIAIISGFSYHIIILVYFMIAGSYGIISIKQRNETIF